MQYIYLQKIVNLHKTQVQLVFIDAAYYPRNCVQREVDRKQTRHFAFFQRETGETRRAEKHEREIELTAARLTIILLIELNTRTCEGLCKGAFMRIVCIYPRSRIYGIDLSEYNRAAKRAERNRFLASGDYAPVSSSTALKMLKNTRRPSLIYVYTVCICIPLMDNAPRIACTFHARSLISKHT